MDCRYEGLKFPIKDENGNIVGYRLITYFTYLDNVAGVIIGLNNKEGRILISYSEIRKIEKEQDYYKDFPFLE